MYEEIKKKKNGKFWKYNKKIVTPVSFHNKSSTLNSFFIHGVIINKGSRHISVC